MKFYQIATLCVLVYSVHSKPTDYDNPDLRDNYGDFIQEDNVQNDKDADYYDQIEEQDRENIQPAPTDNVVVINSSIKSKPETFIKSLDEKVILPCAVSNENVVRVWKKDDVFLFQSHTLLQANNRTSLLPNGSLQIDNLQEEDFGEYACTLMTTNKPQIVHIITGQPKIKSLLAENNNTVLKLDSKLSLTCKVSSYPAANISWHKGEKNSERLGTMGENLVIPNIKRHHAGTYFCLADNSVGTPTTRQIEIKVEFKPEVMVDQITVNTEHNQDTELNCMVHSEPKALVTWQKNGLNIKNTNHTQLQNHDHHHILIIKNIQEDDLGNYVCSARNFLGASEKTITLTKTPAISKFHEPQTDTKDIVLMWEVQSKSPVSSHELQYRKKGNNEWKTVIPVVTNGEHDGTYTVKYVLEKLGQGVYETRVRSQNNHGWSDYSEIRPFSGVYAKHPNGHSKAGPKKNHTKEPKVKHITSTPPHIDDEVSAEHQEGEKKESPAVGATKTSGVSLSCASSTWVVSIALLVLPVQMFRQ